MLTSDYDYELPEELIAQHPLERRDRSRLLVLRPARGTWEHRVFSDLPELLATGDLVVRNRSRVIRARLRGSRASTGGKWEGLFLREEGTGHWEILSKARGRLRVGERVVVGRGLELELIEQRAGGTWLVRVPTGEPSAAILERHGSIPLPPYIRGGREAAEDAGRYQTVYAGPPGSVAAPTAGLHFTDETFRALRGRGIDAVDLTLHVGVGTFRPIQSERLEGHRMHAEAAELTAPAADRLNRAREAGGRIVAVGTTSARVLETAAGADGRFAPFSGETDLYLRPGHRFRGLDALLTNFHLPRSSLLVLVAALAGRDFVLGAYREAVRHRYRFYSYGDAMLILPEGGARPRPAAKAGSVA